MREQIIKAMRSALRPYLEQVYARAPLDKHAKITSMFYTHMAYLADYCMAGYFGAGTLTADFICGLHKVLFPRDYKQTMTTPAGEVVWMVPGEYKQVSNSGDSYIFPNRTVVFIAPDDVPDAMVQVVSTLNSALLAANESRQKQDAILYFVVDFLMVHPFGDANGRVAYMLADLFTIFEELPVFDFTRIKVNDLPAIYRAVELVREKRDLAPIYDVMERYRGEPIAASEVNQIVATT